MTEQNHLSDILSEISPLVADTMNYELRLRGIQPAQAPTTKKVQLAREIEKEQRGHGYTLWPFMPIADDLRCCASLLVQFESMLNSNSRTTLAIENAMINLVFLKVRIERLNSTNQSEYQTINMLKTITENAIKKGRELLQITNDSMTAQEEVIDLVGDRESIHNSTEQFDLHPLFVLLLARYVHDHMKKMYPQCIAHHN